MIYIAPTYGENQDAFSTGSLGGAESGLKVITLKMTSKSTE